MATPSLVAANVHSATISTERSKKSGRPLPSARCTVSETDTAASESKIILVLFAASGIFIYRPGASPKFRFSAATDEQFIDRLQRELVPIAHIAWGVSAREHEDVTVPSDKDTIARMKVEIARLKVKAAASDRLRAEMMRAPWYPVVSVVPVVPDEPSVAGTVGAAFTTYVRYIRGFSYEYSDDFRPDCVPAAQLDANFLYMYMFYNRSKPNCIFPRLVSIVSCTPRFGSNCDYGVVFEHPVSMDEVSLEMRKAFGNLCDSYRIAVRAYLLFSTE
jgi:hypothetical protein